MPGSLGAILRGWWRELLADGRPAADAWEDGWQEALRSACTVLAASDGALEAIDLNGERWIRTNPGRLLRLTDLAHRTAADFGLQVRVIYRDDVPTIQLTRRS
jgi:hypothetical protein